TDATTTAETKLRSTANVPVFIDTREVSIASDSSLEVRDIVPGWCLDVSSTSTCRDIIQRLKIVGLQVTEDGGSGQTPGQERITVQVASANTTDTTGAA